jgi:hypothetical protein
MKVFEINKTIFFFNLKEKPVMNFYKEPIDQYVMNINNIMTIAKIFKLFLSIINLEIYYEEDFSKTKYQEVSNQLNEIIEKGSNFIKNRRKTLQKKK